MTCTRRALVLGPIGIVLTGCAPAGRQPAAGAVRVGYLGYTTAAVGAPYIRAFLDELAALGWPEGRVAMEERYAEGRYDRLPRLAAELARLAPAVIVTAGANTTLAASEVTSTIPIVMIDVADPVAFRLVGSLERPGGNITGLSHVLTDLTLAHLQLLRDVVPGVSKVAVLWNPDNLAEQRLWTEKQMAARVLGWQLRTIEFRRDEDLERALAAIAAARPDALYSVGDPLTLAHGARIAAFALEQRLPTVFGWPDFADAGALLAYAPDPRELFRRAAVYTDKILRGATPADLPIEQPHRFELVVNLRTARALGLTVPDTVLARASRVIR